GHYISQTTTTTALTPTDTKTSQNLHGIWGAPTGVPNRVYAVGDSGALQRMVGPFPFTWSSLNGVIPQALRGVHGAGALLDCWAVGDDEMVTRTTNNTWQLESRGAKI